ncbi:MAG TPA: hypothetical protein VH062_07595 [Polyangiaceae bacterium]|jgi:hypothetical protein|nr:hypothetical protein [Polyangiaceae bacterium]
MPKLAIVPKYAADHASALINSGAMHLNKAVEEIGEALEIDDANGTEPGAGWRELHALLSAAVEMHGKLIDAGG